MYACTLYNYIHAGTSCGVLSNPTDGTVSVPARTVGSTATYSCNTGFNLVGDKTRVCRAGGVWSGKTPDCQGSVECILGLDNKYEFQTFQDMCSI